MKKQMIMLFSEKLEQGPANYLGVQTLCAPIEN